MCVYTHTYTHTHTNFSKAGEIPLIITPLRLLQFHPQTQPPSPPSPLIKCALLLDIPISVMGVFLFPALGFTTESPLTHPQVIKLPANLAFHKTSFLCISMAITLRSVDYLPNLLTVLLTFHLYLPVTMQNLSINF